MPEVGLTEQDAGDKQDGDRVFIVGVKGSDMNGLNLSGGVSVRCLWDPLLLPWS